MLRYAHRGKALNKAIDLMIIKKSAITSPDPASSYIFNKCWSWAAQKGEQNEVDS